MSTYDYYEADPPIACWNCGEQLGRYQGSDGPCLFLLWRQGEAAPVNQLTDEDAKGDWDLLRTSRLPEGVLHVGTLCARCHRWRAVVGGVRAGVWQWTVPQVLPEEIPTVAEAALRSGLDDPDIRLLAGLSGPTWRDVQEPVLRLLDRWGHQRAGFDVVRPSD